MADVANKVEFGLCNVKYAKITSYDAETKKYTYATPVDFLGAVSLTLDAEGDEQTVYADNIAWYIAKANDGYTGSIGMRTIPDDFRTDILGEVKDENGMILENSDAQGEEFALLFQFEGDKNGTRHCMYRCVAGRPSISGKTKEKSVEAYEYSISITAMPRENDHYVKSKITNSSINETAYNAWFDQVTEPTAEAA